MSVPDDRTATRERMLRAARFALHAITTLLVVVTAMRALLDGGDLLVVMLGAAAFLAWYGAGASFAHGRRAVWWLLGLTAVWAVLLFLSAEFVWLAFPILLLVGHVLRLPWSAVLAVVVIAGATAAPILHGGAIGPGIAHIVGPVVGGGFAYGISLGYDALLRDAAEREQLIVSLVRAQRETEQLQQELADQQRAAGAHRERTRLARDLHDTIAQELSSIVLMARAGDDAPVAHIEELARHSLQELRRIVAALAPAELEESALEGALGRMLDELSARTGVVTALQAEGPAQPLSTPTEVVLLRVAQSALANVRQHAQASRVEVSLEGDAETVRMRVVDDGVGFDPAGPLRPGAYGLSSMAARLRELGGDLDIRSAPGEGVRLEASLPRRVEIESTRAESAQDETGDEGA